MDWDVAGTRVGNGCDTRWGGVVTKVSLLCRVEDFFFLLLVSHEVGCASPYKIVRSVERERPWLSRESW